MGFIGDAIDSIFGGGGGDVQVPQNPAEQALAKISQERYDAAKPLETAMLDNMMRFMGYKYVTPRQQMGDALQRLSIGPLFGGSTMGSLFSNLNSLGERLSSQPATAGDGSWVYTGNPYDVSQNPMFAAGKKSASDAYQSAKDSILASLPAGGSLLDALSQARIGEANTMTGLASNLAQDIYNKAYGLATGVPQQSMAGLGNAANAYSNAIGPGVTQQANNNNLLGSLGQGIGWAADNIPWSSVGASIGDAFGWLGSLFSTRRFKKDIKWVGEIKLDNGKTLPLVEYNYVWDNEIPARIGVLAEDAFKAIPEVVHLDNKGLPLAVNYSSLGKHITGVE